jgi:hypothetical protein
MAQLTPEQSQLLMRTARRAGKTLAATVSRSPSIDAIEDATQTAVEAWLTSGRPFAELSEATLIEEVQKQKLLKVERREESGQLLGKARAGEEFQEVQGRTVDEGDTPWDTLKGTREEHVSEAIIHDVDEGVLDQFLGYLLNRPGTPEERLRWAFQVQLFRLHYGEKVFRGQPRLLTQNAEWRGRLTDWQNKKIPLARKQLEQYHQLADIANRSSSCPTCKRIAKFIQQVEQEQVVEAIDRLLAELRSGDWKLSS